MLNLNIHPIFVHFPIALLMVYSVLEIIRFKWLQKFISPEAWFYVKATFVIIGAAMSYLTWLTGELAEDIVGHSSLIETHSNFAIATILIFSILAVAYKVAWLRKMNFQVWSWVVRIQTFLIETPFIFLLILAGAACLLITGVLGGSIVYGQGMDPFSDFIYNLIIR